MQGLLITPFHQMTSMSIGVVAADERAASLTTGGAPNPSAEQARSIWEELRHKSALCPWRRIVALPPRDEPPQQCTPELLIHVGGQVWSHDVLVRANTLFVHHLRASNAGANLRPEEAVAVEAEVREMLRRPYREQWMATDKRWVMAQHPNLMVWNAFDLTERPALLRGDESVHPRVLQIAKEACRWWRLKCFVWRSAPPCPCLQL